VVLFTDYLTYSIPNIVVVAAVAASAMIVSESVTPIKKGNKKCGYPNKDYRKLLEKNYSMC